MFAYFLVAILLCGIANALSTDGELISAFSAEDGPLSKEILSNNPKLAFLGSGPFGENYYIERTKVTQASARAGCQNLGMKLVPIHSPLQLAFLGTVMTSDDDYVWSDIRMFRNLASFVIDQDCENSICSPLPSDMYETSWDNSVGLAIKRNAGQDSTFSSRYTTTLYYYICWIVPTEHALQEMHANHQSYELKRDHLFAESDNKI